MFWGNILFALNLEEEYIPALVCPHLTSMVVKRTETFVHLKKAPTTSILNFILALMQ